MTYRDAALAPAPERPPPLLGFAFYVMGVGCGGVGIGHLVMLAPRHGVRSPVLDAAGWGVPVGQLMIFLGLAIAWRTMRRTPLRRPLGVAAVLWLALLVMFFESPEIRRALAFTSAAAMSGAPHVASWVGAAIALGLVAFVVHRAGRTFAGRTWATTLGASLVASRGLEAGWSRLVQPAIVGGALGSPREISLGAVGFLFMAGGLFAAGREILRGTTLEQLARANPASKRARAERETDPTTPALTRGLPLLGDASVTLAGVLFVHDVVVALARLLGASRHDVADIADVAGLGGMLAALALLALAFHRLRPLGPWPLRLASAAVIALVVATVTLYVKWSWPTSFPDGPQRLVAVVPALLGAGALLSASRAAWLTPASTTLGGEGVTRLPARLAASAVLVLAARSASWLGLELADPALRFVVLIVAALLAGAAFFVAISAAREVRRLEVSLARARDSIPAR